MRPFMLVPLFRPRSTDFRQRGFASFWPSLSGAYVAWRAHLPSQTFEIYVYQLRVKRERGAHAPSYHLSAGKTPRHRVTIKPGGLGRAAVDYAVPTRGGCLYADKRGQVWCRPFFTTFLSPRRFSYLSRSVAHGRYFLALRRCLRPRFHYPVFTPLVLAHNPLLLFFHSPVDLLANNRVYRGLTTAFCRRVCGSREIVVRGTTIDISRRVSAPKVSVGHYSSRARSLLSAKIFTR